MVVDGVLAAIYMVSPALPSMDKNDKDPLFLAGILHLVAMIADVTLATVAGTGAAWEVSKRAGKLPWALGFRLVMEIPKGLALAWLLTEGHLLIFSKADELAAEKGLLRFWDKVYLLVLSTCQVLDILGRLSIFLLVGPRSGPIRALHEQPLFLATGSKMFQFLGWLANTKGQELLVITLMEKFMDGFDWTVGDAMQAAILLQASQDKMRIFKKPKSLEKLGMHVMPEWGDREERRMLRSCGGALPELESLAPATTELVEDVEYKLGYAFASYGFALNVVLPAGAWGAKVECCPAIRCCRDSRAETPLNLRYAQGYLDSLPGHDCQVVMYSIEAGINKPMFCVIVDVPKKTVCISIRGTGSLGDAFTDMIATVADIGKSKVTGDTDEIQYVHLGMWQGAAFIEKKLKHSGILEKLKVVSKWTEDLSVVKSPSSFLNCGGGGDAALDVEELLDTDPDFKEPLMQDVLPDCTGFKIVTTGHSLGGAVATYLKAKLSIHYPEVECVGYGAPPLFSPEMAKLHFDKCLYVVVGDDVISRLALRNVEFMRDRMVSLLARCPHSKVNVFASGIMYKVFGSHRIFRLLREFPDVPTEEAHSVLGRFEHRKAQKPFYHAGEQFYIKPVVSARTCANSLIPPDKFMAYVTESECIQEILLNTDSLRHHCADYYDAAIAGAAAASRAGELLAPADAREVRGDTP